MLLRKSTYTARLLMTLRQALQAVHNDHYGRLSWSNIIDKALTTCCSRCIWSVQIPID